MDDQADQRDEATKMNGIHQSISYGVPVLAYAVLIFWVSSVPDFPEELPTFFGFDKIAHVVEYFFFGCLLYRWFASLERFRKRESILLATICFGILYAMSDEWHQSFVPGRDASLWDVLFDAIGIGVGAVSYPFLRTKITVTSGNKG